MSEHKKFYVKRRYAYSPNVDLPKEQWVTQQTPEGYQLAVVPTLKESDDILEGATPNLITSLLEGFSINENGASVRNHAVTLDIDHPCELIPSSSPDKYHLYIHKPITWHAYRNLMKAFAQAGIVEDGFVQAAISNGFTGLRVPGVTKPGSNVTNSDIRKANALVRREAFLHRQHAVRYHRIILRLTERLKDTMSEDEFNQMLEEIGVDPFAVPNPVYT